MTYHPLNTPIQAQHLAQLYGEPRVENPKWMIVGEEQHIDSWVHLAPSMTLYGLRTWDEEKLQHSQECTGLYLYLEHEHRWQSIVDTLLAKRICVIRHGLPIGTKLKQAYELIPTSHRSLLPNDSSFGTLMNRISKQETPNNPITRLSLSNLMKHQGWNYVCDLSTFRDFGHENEDLEKRDSLCGLIWRDSLFIRTKPLWSLCQNEDFVLLWRIKSKKKVTNGWVYTTLEGLQLGFRSDDSLEKYTDWNVLCADHKEYVYSLIHSGLLSLGVTT